MRLPKNVDIFGKRIPIRKHKDFIAVGEDGIAAGLYMIHEQEIHVVDKKEINPTHTLIHEMVHAMWHRTGLAQAGVSYDLQEIIAENIATIMDENFTLRRKSS